MRQAKLHRSDHVLHCNDSRSLEQIPDESVHLVVTSPPYWTLKRYEEHAAQLGHIEFILFQRKPGGYRAPELRTRLLSIIPEAEHRDWFQQIWTVTGASTRQHPAPFPLVLAERLVRMYSFVGDTVLDPFMGTGTTNLAAATWGRNSIGVEIEPAYYRMAESRFEKSVEQQTQRALAF
jgi:DNA modification methylase